MLGISTHYCKVPYLYKKVSHTYVPEKIHTYLVNTKKTKKNHTKLLGGKISTLYNLILKNCMRKYPIDSQCEFKCESSANLWIYSFFLKVDIASAQCPW